jgi:hypothetical protein
MYNIFVFAKTIPSSSFIWWVRWVTYLVPLDNSHVRGGLLLGPKKVHINMGSSFENLVATSLMVKTDPKSDKRFGLQNILNF